jgi:hypothetical protein
MRTHRRGLLVVLAACPLLATCGGSSSPGSAATGYWSASCVSGDGRYLIAGGDHAALVDLTSGKVVEIRAGMVKGVGCDADSGVVVGYDKAVRLPGQSLVAPVPDLAETVLALSPEAAWISSARTASGGHWRGPALLYVSEKGQARRTELPPALFGEIGAARPLPTPDTFAVRFGNLMSDGRLLLAAGWQPSRTQSTVEQVPWGLFAWDLGRSEATPLTQSLKSDLVFNQNWFQRVAAGADGALMAVAVHDGERLSVAQIERGADAPSRVTSSSSKGAPSAVAVSADNTLVAVGSETRGSDAPGKAWVIDRAGKELWRAEFPKTVIGLHFLSDNSLVVAVADASAARVALPAGNELWTSSPRTMKNR